MLSKIRDAAAMLWQSFDAREREIAMYAMVYASSFLLNLYLRSSRMERQRREHEQMQHMAQIVKASLERAGAGGVRA